MLKSTKKNRCPKNHESGKLEEVGLHWECDKCKNKHKPNEKAKSCRACDYDVCFVPKRPLEFPSAGMSEKVDPMGHIHFLIMAYLRHCWDLYLIYKKDSLIGVGRSALNLYCLWSEYVFGPLMIDFSFSLNRTISSYHFSQVSLLSIS